MKPIVVLNEIRANSFKRGVTGERGSMFLDSAISELTTQSQGKLSSCSEFHIPKTFQFSWESKDNLGRWRQSCCCSSTVRSGYCSWKFSSQHPYQAAHNHP